VEILNETLESYINNLYKLEKGELGLLQKYAYENDLPIIKPETVQFLKTILAIKKPKNILEIGCLIGFSAGVMASCDEDIRITTIDRYDVMIEKAKANFKKLGLEDRITLIEGSALYVLENLTENEMYDLIFLDASKGQYINFLPHCLRLLKPQGILISDNILQKGDIAKKREEIVKRHRTIYKNMQDFLYALTNSDNLQSTIIPIGDGIGLTVKME